MYEKDFHQDANENEPTAVGLVTSERDVISKELIMHVYCLF
jgi:hypothetical protein